MVSVALISWRPDALAYLCMSLYIHTYLHVIFRCKVKKSLVKGESDLMKSTLSMLSDEKKGGKLREGREGKTRKTHTYTCELEIDISYSMIFSGPIGVICINCELFLRDRRSISIVFTGLQTIRKYNF